MILAAVQEATNHDLVWAAVLQMMGAVLVGLLVLTGVIYQSRKTRGKLDTGNERDIGFTVHDMSQTQEIIQVQTRTNTKELLEVIEKFDAHLEDSKLAREELHQVRQNLEAHVDDVAPLVAWTAEQMEGDKDG
jgi:hypothetical protein